jgi:DNA topoisomerase-1
MAAPATAAGTHAAAAVGLSYVRGDGPGITRERRTRGFIYRSPDGTRVRDAAVLARIRALAIPPAWHAVWICTSPQGHLQATGRDARGRKQYRYHSSWRKIRDQDKYDRLASFVRALPRIRRRVRADLGLAGLPRDKVTAAVVRLLETTFIRVGNERYARDNGSYGLTTLRNRHVRVAGERIRFQFRGKSGKQHAVELNDAQLARIIRRCRELPGYELFQYVEDGVPRSLGSADINAYLQRITGRDYSAKDFRTWGGTLVTGLALEGKAVGPGVSGTTRTIAEAIRKTAAELGNTAVICRKCYVHPSVIESFIDGRLRANATAGPGTLRGLGRDEKRILAILEKASRRKTRERPPALASRHATIAPSA